MGVLAGKKIVLGITGGIAAYKTPLLVRALRLAGAEVRVVLTPAAQHFVTPLTLQTLSGQRVALELFDLEREYSMGHIELARWADLVLVAPASADFLARLTLGMADDLLTTLCLASDSPLVVAPAMNQQMWQHPATQENLATLGRRGVRIWGPASGIQACGEEGPGRLLEPEELFARLAGFWQPGPLSGVRVLMTAGPTREPLDPVRFLSNRSSGKMGYALAVALRELGAEVTLVSGPVELPYPADVFCLRVETALEMHQAVMPRVKEAQIFVATAAVADYRPADPAPRKIKKHSARLDLRLTPNPDILAEVAALPEAPFCVGFAAETEELERHAKAKLAGKKVQMVAANLVGEGRGFESDLNALEVFWRDGSRRFDTAPKPILARQLAALIAERYHAQHSGKDS